MSELTSREAADRVEECYGRYAIGQNAVALRVLIDLGRATSPAPEGDGDLAGVADLLNDVSMSDDLAAEGPAINALSVRVRAHRCSPAPEGGDHAAHCRAILDYFGMATGDVVDAVKRRCATSPASGAEGGDLAALIDAGRCRECGTVQDVEPRDEGGIVLVIHTEYQDGLPVGTCGGSLDSAATFTPLYRAPAPSVATPPHDDESDDEIEWADDDPRWRRGDQS